VAAHCVELSDDDLELIARSGLGVAHCPTSNMKLGNGAARIAELCAAGATVGLGTDSVMTNNNLDPFEEMRQAALLAKFVSSDATTLDSATVFAMATIGSARVLGLDDQVGSIEVGKQADLVVVGTKRAHLWPLFREGGGNVIEQLVWSCSGADVRTTIVGGEILLEDGHLQTLDLAEIEELVTAEATHLLRSAGVLDHVTRRNR
jgi:5-methylthioadenosine/S-adenosylhomocysteine deaminase